MLWFYLLDNFFKNHLDSREKRRYEVTRLQGETERALWSPISGYTISNIWSGGIQLGSGVKLAAL